LGADILIFRYTRNLPSRLEDLPGSSAPFHSSGGYFWSQFIGNPFGLIPLISETSQKINGFFHNFSNGGSCTFSSSYPRKKILEELCYSDVEKYAYFPTLISIFLIMLVIYILAFLKKVKILEHKSGSNFYILLLIFSIIYWIMGGIGSYFTLFAPYFRSYSRLMVFTALIILILSYKLFIQKLKNSNQNLTFLLVAIVFALDSVIPSWNPILLKYTKGDIKEFTLNLDEKNFNSELCSLITYPVRPKQIDSDLYDTHFDVRLIHLISKEPGLRVSTGFLTPENSKLDRRLQDWAQLTLPELASEARKSNFCGIIVLNTQYAIPNLELNSDFSSKYDYSIVDENVGVLLFR
jgi:hypothetical protein